MLGTQVKSVRDSFLFSLASLETVVHLGELSCLKQGRRRRKAE